MCVWSIHSEASSDCVSQSIAFVILSTSCLSVSVARSAVMPASTSCFVPRAPRTVTVKLRVVELPARSSAVHVTVVTPIENVLPDAGAHECVTPGQLSDDVTTYDTGAPASLANSTTIGGGMLSAGASLSFTVIFCVQLDELPAASNAVQVINVVPTG